MRATTFNHLSLAIIAVCITSVFPTEYVPVYLWGQSTSSGLVPALSRVSKESFKDVVLSSIEKKSFIVVFAEKNLSPEDFSQTDENGQSVLSKLSNMETERNYWPSVQNPLNILHHLPEIQINEVSIQENTKVLDDLKINPEDQILVINLNDAREDEARTEMLKRHDDLIAKVYDRLAGEKQEILAIYTSKHSSWIVPEDQHKHRRQWRQLLAAGDENNTTSPELHNTTQILMYTNSAPILINDTETKVLNGLTAETTMTGDNSITLTLKKADLNVEITMDIILTESNYWIVENMTVKNGENTENVKLREIYAPVGFSYHCSSNLYHGQYSKMNIAFPGWQIQPNFGNATHTAFGDAYDCVGFTSAPIWSGLFVTFILVLILTLGISMMMDIKTMDRFDDPKGKTITIIASE